jgi:flavin reductase (DIM6/NTAB) family NADH-FMN oxidoreductase RutF
LAHETGAHDVPILPQALARFDCLQVATHDGGDHLIIVGRVLRASARDGQPLIFSQGGYGRFTPGL